MTCTHVLHILRYTLYFAMAIAATAIQAQASFSPGPKFTARDGEALYASICAGCHMAGGAGAAGAGQYPPLARNGKLASAAYATFMVVRGNKAMPGFEAQLSDQQIASVVNFVRSSFGNTWTDPVSPSDAAALRR